MLFHEPYGFVEETLVVYDRPAFLTCKHRDGHSPRPLPRYAPVGP